MRTDIKALIETVVKKVEADPRILTEFKTDPIKAVEDLVGIEIPEETVQAVVAAVKAKLFGDEVAQDAKRLGESVAEKVKEAQEKAGGLFDTMKKLF